MSLSKKIAMFGASIVLSACVTNTTIESNSTDSIGLQDLITCNHGTDAAKAFRKHALDPDFASVSPNNRHFYVPKNPMTAFGLNVEYFGLRGIDFARGPNAYFVADEDKVIKAIETNTDLKLNVKSYKSHAAPVKNSKDKVVAMVVVMPPIQGSTAVICGLIPGR